MKTPMQEMLERVKEYRDLESSPLAISRLNSVYIDILGMLEKEKQQIMDAHINGQSEFDNGAYRQEVIDNAEQYYNETYGGNNEQQ